VQPPFPELEKGQMTALEHLFAQTATTVTPGRKKGAPDGMHSLLITMCFSVASWLTCCPAAVQGITVHWGSKSCHNAHAINCTSNQCGVCQPAVCVDCMPKFNDAVCSMYRVYDCIPQLCLPDQ